MIYMKQDRVNQRAELHKTIWSIADDLRGSVDGWDFKSYILGMLFYRYISENLASTINSMQRAAGIDNFSYADLPDETAEGARAVMLEEKGFYILPSQLFENVLKEAERKEAQDSQQTVSVDKELSEAESDNGLNVALYNAFKAIEDSCKGTPSEDDFSGLFDDIDVNSRKLGGTTKECNKKLLQIMQKIGSLDLGNFEDNTIDAFGDAYEFLMAMYASNAGKSGGEYFTPQEVSELLARIVIGNKEQVEDVYDPACGSGSLLLKFAKLLGKDNVKKGFYGQEFNITTYNLCRINMFLHNINFNKFDIARGDTLIHPQHNDVAIEHDGFECIVSNPPYSTKWIGQDDPTLINDPRFAPAGKLAPKSKADLAFTMHMLSYLSENGAAAIVEFPGVMYRGGAEKKIRQYLVDNNFVDCIIQLPDNLFFGTSIATCIIVLKKNKQDTSVLFIDASKEFVKVTNNNKLSDENIKTIVSAYQNKENIKHFAKLASQDDIKEEDYNLSVNMYVEPEDLTEKIDIDELNANIKEIVAREEVLRREIDKIIAEIEGGKDE